MIPDAASTTKPSPPAGHGADVILSPGTHKLRATILRPPTDRDAAEWVVALAEAPVFDWVPSAFR